MFTATTALPYEHLERATAGLRAELRQQILAADLHQLPDWETLTLTGPPEFTDLRGADLLRVPGHGGAEQVRRLDS